MQPTTLKVAAVSYTNTIPFIHGLRSHPGLAGIIDLHLMPPAACAEAFRSGEVDFALVPVGAMQEEDLENLCCNWCLGADGPVESVLLLSDTELEDITTIFLDQESRTSVLMVAMLARFHWNISPHFRNTGDYDKSFLQPGEAFLLIGDKTFGMSRNFTYHYDLAEAWQSLTGLPAVFACWLTKPSVSAEKKTLFNEALSWGANHIDEAIRAWGKSDFSFEYTRRYLTRCISFQLDDRKREAIRRFFEYRKML